MTSLLHILIFGDIVGKPGRAAIVQAIALERKGTTPPDLIIANAENTAHGQGVSLSALRELQDAGVDVFTNGDHAWDTKDANELYADTSLPLLRPANYPPGLPGRGILTIERGTTSIAIISLLGRVFFRQHVDDPFRALDALLDTEARDATVVLVDFHAEATSEKQGLGWHADGKVTAVWGTHTHVQTADERMLPDGTAFLTDVGMTGAYNSIIGSETESVLRRFHTQIPGRLDIPDDGPRIANMLRLIVDPRNGRATEMHTEHLLFDA